MSGVVNSNKIIDIADYRDFLRAELESRCARNPRYSLRAYAKDLGLSAASLSLILNGKQGVSRQKAVRMAKALGFTQRETQQFCDQVDAFHARSRVLRIQARARLDEQDQGSTLTLECFQVISDWHHLAILELTEIDGFVSDPQWIARELGLSEKAVKLAIERLIKLELLEKKNGVLRQTSGFMATPSGIPSQTIKRFHQQILKKAETALFSQPLDARDFATLLFPVALEDLAWAKNELKTFRRKFLRRLANKKKKDRVYCLSTQFFHVHEDRKNQKEKEV